MMNIFVILGLDFFLGKHWMLTNPEYVNACLVSLVLQSWLHLWTVWTCRIILEHKYFRGPCSQRCHKPLALIQRSTTDEVCGQSRLRRSHGGVSYLRHTEPVISLLHGLPGVLHGLVRVPVSPARTQTCREQGGTRLSFNAHIRYKMLPGSYRKQLNTP